MVKLYIINTQSVCGALTHEHNIVVGHKDIKIDFFYSFTSPSFEWIHIPFNMCELL